MTRALLAIRAQRVDVGFLGDDGSLNDISR